MYGHTTEVPLLSVNLILLVILYLIRDLCGATSYSSSKGAWDSFLTVRASTHHAEGYAHLFGNVSESKDKTGEGALLTEENVTIDVAEDVDSSSSSSSSGEEDGESNV